jgi:hypothetical protein
VSFETRRRDESVQHFMVAERRAEAARLWDAQAVARADTHRLNIEAVMAVIPEAEQRLAQADRTKGLAMVAVERQ